MAVRIKDGMIPYTWWTGIEITNNHVINVLLREMNNLIMVNEDRELYVDLQLPDGIQPDDDFPVWVTTGKILQEDWRDQSGIILNWKTTSWDYVRLIYANDWKLYYDPWTWQWIELWGSGASVWVATSTALWTIKLGSDTKQTVAPETPTSTANRSYAVQLNNDNQAIVNVPWTDTTYTAGTNITIDNNNEISANLPQALVYKGTVNDLTDLPASWTVWDTYFVEWEDGMYSWDWTQWAYVWGTGIDVSNFFNKLTDNSDDITQGTTNLFVTQAEKNYWNGKQDHLTAWNWIDITNNVVSNDLPFDPSNTWSLGQVLKRTSTGYRWADETGEEYTAWDWINITSWNVIENTAQFDPSNEWTTGQVLKKTSNGYSWQDESWWGWGNFNPQNAGTTGQVLTKTATGYDWETIAGWEWNVKLFTLQSTTDTATMQLAMDWLNAWKMPIIKCNATFGYVQMTDDYYFYPVVDSTSTSTNMIFQAIPTSNNTYILPNWIIRRARPIIRVVHNNWTVSSIEVTTAEAEREDTAREWIWTQTQFNQLWSYENWRIYNIIPV